MTSDERRLIQAVRDAPTAGGYVGPPRIEKSGDIETLMRLGWPASWTTEADRQRFLERMA